MKSFSKTFNIPIPDKSIQSQQLLRTMKQIALRQQELMQQKLMRQQQIQNRLKQLQHSYQVQALKKQQKIKQKLQKSQKNRIQFLEKIVKRCKDKDKVFNQKIKTTTSKRKQSLREAWKAATQFNQKILQGKLSRHKSQNKDQTQLKHKQQNLNKSLLIPDQIDQSNKSLTLLQGPSSNRGQTKSIQSAFANNKSFLKPYDNMAFQTSFHIDKKLQRPQKPILTQIPDYQKNIQQNPQNTYQQKLRKTLVRHQQFLMDQQNKKIQQYGQRLQKINLSRRKKDQLHKSRIKKNNINQDDYYDDSTDKKQQKLNKKTNKQRLKSESQSCHRVKRVSDWSKFNKQRRQQLLNAHIEEGNQYLSQNKIRYLKQIMSRNIAYGALQKKLYLQRFKHN